MRYDRCYTPVEALSISHRATHPREQSEPNKNPTHHFSSSLYCRLAGKVTEANCARKPFPHTCAFEAFRHVVVAKRVHPDADPRWKIVLPSAENFPSIFGWHELYIQISDINWAKWWGCGAAMVWWNGAATDSKDKDRRRRSRSRLGSGSRSYTRNSVTLTPAKERVRRAGSGRKRDDIIEMSEWLFMFIITNYDFWCVRPTTMCVRSLLYVCQAKPVVFAVDFFSRTTPQINPFRWSRRFYPYTAAQDERVTFLKKMY